jgi:hypothetical protein
MYDGPLVFKPVEAWNADFVLRDGFDSVGGNVLFIEKNDAILHGMNICKINMPEGDFTYLDGDVVRKIPLIEEYEYFYVAVIALDMILNDDLEMLMDEDLPAIWFTKKEITPRAIMELQKMSI